MQRGQAGAVGFRRSGSWRKLLPPLSFASFPSTLALAQPGNQHTKVQLACKFNTLRSLERTVYAWKVSVSNCWLQSRLTAFWK